MNHLCEKSLSLVILPLDYLGKTISYCCIVVKTLHATSLQKNLLILSLARFMACSLHLTKHITLVRYQITVTDKMATVKADTFGSKNKN